MEAYKNYRPVTMWFWNHEITKEGISKQIEAMKSQGIHEFFVHALWGLTTEYFCDEYMELIRFAVSEAKKRDMRFWIYDEYAYPSGQNNGRFQLAADGADRAKNIVRHEAKSENGVCKTEVTGKLLYAEEIRDGKRFSVAATEENGFFVAKSENTVVFYTVDFVMGLTAASVYSKHCKNLPGHADLYCKKVADDYLDYTYGGYEKTIGDEMGKTVIGSFTDEDYATGVFEVGRGRLSYTPSMIKVFEERTGRSFNESLHYLFEKSESEESYAVKHAYWKIIEDLYMENFLIPLAKRCEKNDLALTGHLNGDGFMTWGITTHADFFDGLKYFGAPGFDWVMPNRTIDDKKGDKITIGAVCRSVSKFFNKERVICETYSGAGYDYPFSEKNRTACYAFVLGCNLLQYMGGYYSIDGGRKYLPYGLPPSHHYNNPDFKYFRTFGDMAELPCRLSSETKTATGSLMMMPRAECVDSLDFADHTFGEDFNNEKRSIEHAEGLFESVAEAFLRNGEPLDVISESHADDITVKNGKASFNGFEFDRIIFPAMRVTTAAVKNMIKRLEGSKTELIFLRDLPSVTAETGKSDTLGFNFFRRESFDIFTVESGEGVAFVSFDKNGKTPDCEKIRALFRRHHAFKAALGFEYNGDGRCYIIERENEDKRVWFIFNPDKDEKAVKFTDLPENIAFYDQLGKRLDVTVERDLQGYEFIIAISLKNGEAATEEIKPALSAYSEMTVPVTFEKSGKNLWRPKKVRAEVEGEELEVTFQHLIMDKLGKEYKLSFELECDYTGDVYFGGEYEDVSKILLNGIEIKPVHDDGGWGCFNFKNDVSGLVKKGKNTVEVFWRVPDWLAPHTIPFFYFEGGFYADEKGISDKEITVSYDLTENGMRFFAGDAVFTADFEGKKGKRTEIDVKTENPFELFVNGVKHSDVILHDNPVEITELLSDGKNEIKIILTAGYGSLFGEYIEDGEKKRRRKLTEANHVGSPVPFGIKEIIIRSER